jgi:hypothetical protein
MSSRIGKLMKKPLTREEFLKVMEVFERQTDQKIAMALKPWYVKLWRRWRGRKARRIARRIAPPPASA